MKDKEGDEKKNSEMTRHILLDSVRLFSLVNYRMAKRHLVNLYASWHVVGNDLRTIIIWNFRFVSRVAA